MPSALRLYPVGRLDIDATGLILLTNDGELANRLTHPRFEVPKTYRVTRRPRARPRSARWPRCATGVDARRRARPRPPGCAGSAAGLRPLELTIHEGRNRQIKRMCERVGHRVRRLERVAFGPLTLGDLAADSHGGSARPRWPPSAPPRRTRDRLRGRPTSPAPRRRSPAG